MKIIEKDQDSGINISQCKVGDVFKLMDSFDNTMKDCLMICESIEHKYYFVSLDDSGDLYGWGNGAPAESIEKLFDQVIWTNQYYLKPVNATLTITNK